MQIEVAFPVQGETIPTDHAYHLYSALSHCVPAFHDEGAAIRFSPISGGRGDKGVIRLADYSRLRIRLAADQIAVILPLAGHARGGCEASEQPRAAILVRGQSANDHAEAPAAGPVAQRRAPLEGPRSSR